MEPILNFLHNLSTQVPLSIYTSVGGLFEEIIAPIPSPLIMTSAGSIAQEQGKIALYIILISAFAAVGKTIGALIIYYFADKAEDVVLSKFGKFLGVTHKEVESFGKKFNQTWHDDVLLIFLRAVPIFPGAPVAAVCGLIKLNMRTYIQSTLIGVWIRSMIFGYIGYYGLSYLEQGVTSAENLGMFLFLMLVGIPTLYLFYKKRDHWQENIFKLLDRKK